MLQISRSIRVRPSRICRLALRVGAAVLLVAPWALAADKKDKQEPPPAPEDVRLQTSDDVSITATYYPSNEGKKAAAVILLHASGGSRADLASLALKLQAAGSAVIAPDLRGPAAGGRAKEPQPADYDDMVKRDMEAVKNFLLAKNNAGELNIDRLGVVGVEMGATIAVNWAALDWSWPVLATGKQGQDVKALVLISPEWSFKGVRISEAMVQPSVRSELAFLIVTGSRNSKLAQEARRLYNALTRYHVESSDDIEKQTLFLRTPPTSLQGTQLLNEKSVNVQQMIVQFVELRLLKLDLPWQNRKGPL